MQRSTIIIDACLAITHGNARALDLVIDLRCHDVTIAQRAMKEVTRQAARDELESAVGQAKLRVESIIPEVPGDQEALARFDSSPRFRGRGDAEVLALAAARGWIVGSDDVAVRRVAVEAFGPGRVAGTLDFLRWAVSEGRLTLREGVERLQGLDVGPGLLRRLQRQRMSVEEVLGAVG